MYSELVIGIFWNKKDRMASAAIAGAFVVSKFNFKLFITSYNLVNMDRSIREGRLIRKHG